MSCGVGHRCDLDPTLLCLWHRLAATAPIRPLALEPPYAVGAALEKTKRQKIKCWISHVIYWLFSESEKEQFSVYRMVISISVLYPCNLADWEPLWPIAPAQYYEIVSYHILPAWGETSKFKIQELFLLNADCFHVITLSKTITWTIIIRGMSVFKQLHFQKLIKCIFIIHIADYLKKI